MNDMHISLFGNLQIQYGNQHNIEIKQRRAQELVCYLLLYSERLHEREKLATLMWGDKPPIHSKQYLRQTLWQVQSSLQRAACQHHLLLAEHDCIGINPHVNFWLDVRVFDQAFACVQNVPGNVLNIQQIDILRDSLQLYQGDLLDGWYQDWCIYERKRRQDMYIAMLDKLLVYSETHHQYEMGLAYGLQILHHDRAHERTHRRLMRLHYLAGNRSAALKQYEACTAALAEELGVKPAKSTSTLYEQICADHIHATVPSTPVTDIQSGLPVAPVADAQQQLVQIQATLTQLQVQMTHLMQTIERTALDHD